MPTIQEQIDWLIKQVNKINDKGCGCQDCGEDDVKSCVYLQNMNAAYGGFVDYNIEIVLTFTTCQGVQETISHYIVPMTDSEDLVINKCIQNGTLKIRNAATSLEETVSNYEQTYLYTFPDEGIWEMRFITASECPSIILS